MNVSLERASIKGSPGRFSKVPEAVEGSLRDAGLSSVQKDGERHESANKPSCSVLKRGQIASRMVSGRKSNRKSATKGPQECVCVRVRVSESGTRTMTNGK